MQVNGSKNKNWKDYADLLNKEFGGKSLNHCSKINGESIAVIPGLLKACSQATHKKGTPTICEYKEANIFPDFGCCLHAQADGGGTAFIQLRVIRRTAGRPFRSGDGRGRGLGPRIGRGA